METLGQYRDLFAVLAGENSRAVKFLDAKIAQQGRDEKVLAAESQMMALLVSMLDEN